MTDASAGSERRRAWRGREAVTYSSASLLFSSTFSLISSLPLHFFALCRYKAAAAAAWVNNGVNRRQRGEQAALAAAVVCEIERASERARVRLK